MSATLLGDSKILSSGVYYMAEFGQETDGRSTDNPSIAAAAAEDDIDPCSMEYALRQQYLRDNAELKGRVQTKVRAKSGSNDESSDSHKKTPRFDLKVTEWDYPSKYVQQEPKMDTYQKAEVPGNFGPYMHVALPPVNLQSETMPEAYCGKEKAKYNRGLHEINATVDMNGDHFNNDGDVRRFYWLKWSIPVGLKGSITGPICVENDYGEQIPTRDWYSVSVKRDEGNVWTEGFVMHYDEKSNQWIRFNKLKFMFDTEESVGPAYGRNPGQCWTGPALEKAPVVMADVLKPTRAKLEK